MEVHTHSNTAGKKWSHYLWEFLMLFLAENVRENALERHRERQFVQSFIEDLKTDTASIRTALAFRKLKMTQMDSFMLLLSTQTIKGHENELYFYGRSLVRSVWFQSNDRTITQLKNSGS